MLIAQITDHGLQDFTARIHLSTVRLFISMESNWRAFRSFIRLSRKHIYFTNQLERPLLAILHERSPWHIKKFNYRATRNWAKTDWNGNSISNPTLTLLQSRWCDRCLVPLDELMGDSGNSNILAYYVIAHASKFVDPGSIPDSN